MNIKYCIFDICDVCYPYSSAPAWAYIQELVADKDSFDKINQSSPFDLNPLLKGKVSYTQFCQDLCAHYHIPYHHSFNDGLSIADHAGVGPFIDITAELMTELRAQGIEICLLSNLTIDLADIVPDMVDKDKRFLSYELGLIKPDQKIFEVVLQKLNAKPQEVLFIDDSEQNIASAQNLGINGIIFNQADIKTKVQNLLA